MKNRPLKKLKLSIDLELIIMGEKLTDLEINFARKVLKSQFPEVNGLHLTRYSQRLIDSLLFKKPIS